MGHFFEILRGKCYSKSCSFQAGTNTYNRAEMCSPFGCTAAAVIYNKLFLFDSQLLCLKVLSKYRLTSRSSGLLNLGLQHLVVGIRWPAVLACTEKNKSRITALHLGYISSKYPDAAWWLCPSFLLCRQTARHLISIARCYSSSWSRPPLWPASL